MTVANPALARACRESLSTDPFSKISTKRDFLLILVAREPDKKKIRRPIPRVYPPKPIIIIPIKNPAIAPSNDKNLTLYPITPKKRAKIVPILKTNNEILTE